MDCKSNEYRIHITEPDGSERVISCVGFVVISDHIENIEVDIRNMGKIDFLLGVNELLSHNNMDSLTDLLKKQIIE